MSMVPLTPSPAGGNDAADDSRGTNYSTPAPPLSLDSLTLTSPPAPIPPPGPVKLTARACLYEICAKNHWIRPVFACCDEQGPSNLRSFTFKATIEMKEASKLKTVVECFGKPQFNKKTAADSAAEGVLWYLAHLGYPKKHGRSKKLR